MPKKTLKASAFNGGPDTKVRILTTLKNINFTSKNTLVLLDKNLENAKEVQFILNSVPKHTTQIIKLEGSEKLKEYNFYTNLSSKLPEKKIDNLIIVGSGAIINLGLYLAHDRKYPRPVIVPTNTMSISDVAIGSLGLLNKDNVKNKLRVYCDPSEILISKKIFQDSPISVQTDGMSEVLKHAILQESDMLEDSLKAYFGKGDKDEYFELAMKGMKSKIEIQNAAVGGNNEVGILKNYGHLHAHSLEKYFGYSVPHSLAVYVGLMIDTKICGPSKIYSKMLVALKESARRKTFEELLSKLEMSKLERLYRSADDKFLGSGFDSYKLIKVPVVGCYGLLNRKIRFCEVAFSEIAAIYDNILTGIKQKT